MPLGPQEVGGVGRGAWSEGAGPVAVQLACRCSLPAGSPPRPSRLCRPCGSQALALESVRSQDRHWRCWVPGERRNRSQTKLLQSYGQRRTILAAPRRGCEKRTRACWAAAVTRAWPPLPRGGRWRPCGSSWKPAQIPTPSTASGGAQFR